MNRFRLGLILLAPAVCLLEADRAYGGTFDRQWTSVSETSAVVYWQLGDITKSAVSQVEYGTSERLEESTVMTSKPRWSHLHYLTGLKPGVVYYYRLVAVDTDTGLRSESETLSFQTEIKAEALRLPGALSGPPYVLDQPDTYYILTEDVSADGNAFQIAADGVTLDLDGHTVVFGKNTDEQVFGVRFINQGRGTLCNGFVVQGERSGNYSCAIRSNSRPSPTEIFGISTDVHLKCAYPINFLSQASDVQIHHNHLYSRVTEIESRHYPGNALLQMYISGGNIRIHDNLLTEGCHRGIYLSESGINVEVDHNDIRHHQQYVNGYALIPCANADFHHNKITSTGRGAHLTKENIQFHDNYFYLSGHQDLDDLPSGSRPFSHNLIELHGIKFEGEEVVNCKVFSNYVRIAQKLPSDSAGLGNPEDKIENGVYLRSIPAGSGPTSLTDNTQNWETGRWRQYYVRYADGFPPAYISQSSLNTLTANLQGSAGPQYTIYMKWQYVPPTPLNIACYNVQADNEVYGNTFIALTGYEDRDIRHGGYGDTGNWASTIMFVSMDKGSATPGMYSIFVHDNTFISNDLFLNSSSEVNMTVRIENNNFKLTGAPHVTSRESRFRAVGTPLETLVNQGNNQFSLNTDWKNPDINGDGRTNITDAVVFLLKRRQSDHILGDWNVDGREDLSDVVALLREILSTSLTPQNEFTLDALQTVDDISIYTSAAFARLESVGMDGL